MCTAAVAAANTQIAIWSAPKRVALRGRVIVVTSSGWLGGAVADVDSRERRKSSVCDESAEVGRYRRSAGSEPVENQLFVAPTTNTRFSSPRRGVPADGATTPGTRPSRRGARRRGGRTD